MKIIFLSVLCFCCLSLSGQTLELSESCRELSEKTSFEIYLPTESADYKSLNVIKNPYQTYQASIFSRKEDLEIRYAFLPFNEKKPDLSMPNIQLTRTVTSIASNEEDSILSFHEMSRAHLEDFGADWGQVVFLRPKSGFSTEPLCKVVSLYKENKGTVLLFYLFDDADNESLDTRLFAGRFTTE